MAWVEGFLPREERVARRVLFVVTVLGAGMTAAFAVGLHTGLPDPGDVPTAVVCLGIIAVATVLRFSRRRLVWLWAVYPFAVVVAITVLDLLSRDTTVAAHVCYLFPVVYAGSQLRRTAAVWVSVTCAAGDTLVNFALTAPAEATVSACFVSLAFATTTYLLAGSTLRNERLIARLERHAAVDALTGLTTRRVFDRAAETAVAAARTGTGAGLLVLDLDRFKLVNDEHGHPAGDEVLRQLAAVLVRGCRPVDVVARMGGDEIAVLLPDCSADDAVHCAQRLVEAVRGHVVDLAAVSLAPTGGAATVLSLSISVGVAHAPGDGTDLRRLYAAADAALYAAKRGGRDRVAVPPRVVAPPHTLAPHRVEGTRVEGTRIEGVRREGC